MYVVVAAAMAKPATAPSSPASPLSRDGVWHVVPANSFVGYRVRERLGFLPAPSDAVGRTSAVSGTARISGGHIVATSVATDLRTLKSDEARRDRAVVSRLRDQPRARFTLTTQIAVPLLGEEETVRADAHGNLSIHGITRAVIFPLRMRWSRDRLEVISALRIRLSDFRIGNLRVGPVISVSEFAKIEVQLSFARS